MSFDFGQDWLILLTLNDGAYNVKSRYRAVPCNYPSKIDWNISLNSFVCYYINDWSSSHMIGLVSQNVRLNSHHGKKINVQMLAFL